MMHSSHVLNSTARLYLSHFTGNADMPYDFFMSRYKEAYVRETLAFVDCLVDDKPAPCTGKAGLVALVMAIAAGRSAKEKRWVALAEMAGELCSLSGNDQCETDVVDSATGAINFEKLLSPKMGIVMEEDDAMNGPSFTTTRDWLEAQRRS